MKKCRYCWEWFSDDINKGSENEQTNDKVEVLNNHINKKGKNKHKNDKIEILDNHKKDEREILDNHNDIKTRGRSIDVISLILITFLLKILLYFKIIDLEFNYLVLSKIFAYI